MKKISYASLLFTVIVVLLDGCSIFEPKPKPTASFTYFANSGGEIDFTNNSSNANSYLWNFGDGDHTSDKKPVHIYADNGTYTVNMTATGDGGTASTHQDITVTNASGQIMFWHDFNTGHGGINVYVEGVYKGITDQYYSTAPACSSAGCVTVTLSPGTYHYTANTSDNYYTWDDYVTITGGTCITWDLHL